MSGPAAAAPPAALLDRRGAFSSGAVLVEARALRRLIKAHRQIKGIGLRVPHVRCYSLLKEHLLLLTTPEELGIYAHAQVTALPGPEVVLVARPHPRDAARMSHAEQLQRLWRAAFHARVHAAMEGRVREGRLTDPVLRERIDRIGQIEFDEVRDILHQDELLLPPADDRETYIELAALYLELKHFAPPLLQATFPALTDSERVMDVLRFDVDPRLLLETSCPEGVDPAATIALADAPVASLSSGAFVAPRPTFVPPEGAAAERQLERAEAARAQRNLVRAALFCAAVAEGHDPTRVKTALTRLRADVDALGQRLNAALRGPLAHVPDGKNAPAFEWASLLQIVAREAALRSGVRYPVEARLLFDLQNAAIANELPHHAVDVVTWAASFGKRPVVRPLPASRALRVARLFRAAAKRVKLARLENGDRKLLTKLLDRAVERADQNVRDALRPALTEALDAAGLRPEAANGPSLVARDHVVESLLDQAQVGGFLTLGHLRDALSQSSLKLRDLEGPGEWWRGDALLRLDQSLAVTLDGVYRSGEIYLRGLQKLSSLLFGTGVGRAIVFYFVLPLGGAFIALEGLGHVVSSVLSPLGVHHVSLFAGGPKQNPLPEALSGLATASFWVSALILFGVLHSEAFRSVVIRVLRAFGALLSLVFVRFPKWLFGLPAVEQLLDTRPARVIGRHAIVPAGFALAAYGFIALAVKKPHWAMLLAVTLGVFALVSLALATRLGDKAEDLVIEHVAPTWRALSYRVLPGIFRFIVDSFHWLMEAMERILYSVDERLRFREGESKASLYVKAGLGTLWFFVAYAVRVYVALLIEPYVNPVKQVPLTAAAHKIMLPFMGQVASVFNAAFRPLGALVGGPLAAVTTFFFPTIFGFLGWELKENARLYQAQRPKMLLPARVGSHGETLGGLLVPGFHSGTLPKLFARLRHAARREEEIQMREGFGAQGRGADPGPQMLNQHPQAAKKRGDEGARGRFREGAEEVKRSVRLFVERAVLALLAADPRWTMGPVHVTGVDLASNRIRVRLACSRGMEMLAKSAVPVPQAAGKPPRDKPPPPYFELAFEEQSGNVLAGVTNVGWVDVLHGSERRLFENALAGLYKLGAVDLVREQLEMALGDVELPYDIAEGGLIVWPGPGYEIEAIYPLHSDASTLEPIVKIPRGMALSRPLPPLDARQIAFRHHTIPWSAWVYAWTPDAGREVPRLMTGPSLIPAV